ncbi:MAG: hypothetical protein KC506_02530 [Nanoarchaeota archaeon]|nr:hypothetical protein [Nanoarchaeota archaeon]
MMFESNYRGIREATSGNYNFGRVAIPARREIGSSDFGGGARPYDEGQSVRSYDVAVNLYKRASEDRAKVNQHPYTTKPSGGLGGRGPVLRV